MSARAKYHLLNFVAFPVGAAGLMSLGQFHPTLALVAFPYVVLIVVLGRRLRCPNCHEAITKQTYTILGFKVQMESAFIRRHCDSCGYDLSGRGAAAPVPPRDVARAPLLTHPLSPGMPMLLSVVAMAGLACGVWQLLFALTGLAPQLVVPFVLASPLARPLVGVNGALMVPMALAIAKRHRQGFALYLLSMGYNLASTLYFLWHARKLTPPVLAIWAVFTIFVLTYGYLNRGWFRPGVDDDK